MKRRDFLEAATIGSVVSATVGLAAPAIAQSSPKIRWRLTSSFPRTLDTLHGGGEMLAAIVAEATDGDFQIETFAAGEPVPGLQAADAVGRGEFEIAHTASYYYIDRDPAFCWGASAPFGLNTRQHNAWYHQGGGKELLDEFYDAYGFVALPGGNTGAQMGGWYRREIRSISDLNGLKLRIGGIAGRVMAKLGVVPQQTAAADIRAALEKGLIDGAEWVGPYDDEKLRLQEVAPHYYYPGWWEGSTALQFFIAKGKWAELPKSYRAILTAASARVDVDILAKYDARNPAALKRLVQAGAQLRPFPAEVMDAAYKATNELYGEISKENPTFKKLHDAVIAFRNDEYLWWQVGEFGYDAYMIRARRT